MAELSAADVDPLTICAEVNALIIDTAHLLNRINIKGTQLRSIQFMEPDTVIFEYFDRTQLCLA